MISAHYGARAARFGGSACDDFPLSTSRARRRTPQPRRSPSQRADALTAPRRRRRRHSRLRWIGLVLLLVLTSGWLGLRAVQVKQHLTATRGLLTQARSDLLAGRTDVPSLRAAAVETHPARAASRDCPHLELGLPDPELLA